MVGKSARAAIIVAGTLLSSGSWAAAQGQSPDANGAASEFERLDTDGDGRLSRSEAAAKSPLDSHFYLADLDEDGTLDEVEFRAFEILMETVESPGQSI